MLSEAEEIARYRIAERVQAGERRAQLRNAGGEDNQGPGTRHRIAVALHRIADRVEPPARRTTLSFSGR